MYPHLPTSSANFDAFDASWMHQPIAYLVLAAICLIIALRFIKRAIAPVGALLHAVAAAAVVALATALALALVAVAALSIR